MTDIHEKTLGVLLRFLNVAFSNSSTDRKLLHKIEWKEEDGSPSILGEVEVRADTIIGIARTCLKRNPARISNIINALEVNSIYKSKILVNWLANYGDNFPGFLGYIAAIENLRISTLAFLKNNHHQELQLDKTKTNPVEYSGNP